jgi:signal transduction histidine kinase
MAWIALPLMALVFAITGQATRRALRPLEVMTRRVEAIPSARPREGIAPPVGLSEIDALTRAFNELLTRLDETLLSERRFTAEASHELRTPLTALSGEIELALADPQLGPKARDGLYLAAGQARQMQQLVEALLLLRRLGDSPEKDEAGFEPVNLADLVREARPSLLRVYPGREADLQLELPDEVLVSGHPALLASAVGNLLDNALKFTGPGQSVQVMVTDDGGRAEVVVEDAGAGISPLEAKHIFEPFFRGPEARATTAGFGLGLPILKRVIQAHGGDVALEPGPGGGARFVLHLPLWSAARA